MKIIKASAVKHNDMGFVCYLTLTEARILKDLCRKVGDHPGLATSQTSRRITRRIIDTMSNAQLAAPVAYFHGNLTPVPLQVQSDEH